MPHGRDKHVGLETPRGSGQSQGGAYSGQERAGGTNDGADRSRSHGGQSVQAYHGPANPNATSKEDE